MPKTGAPPRRPSPALTAGKLAASGHGLGARAWWSWLKRIGSLAFFVLIVALLTAQARGIEWTKVITSLEQYPLSTVLGAVMLMLASHGLYSCFDLLSRHYSGHKLATLEVMSTNYVSYVFNLNFGSILGAIAIRYRMYSRLGLAPGVITRIVSFSMLTNWMGYILLVGLVFSIQPPAVPDGWNLGDVQLRIAGFVLLVVAMGYVLICTFKTRRNFMVRGHQIELPSPQLASLQLAMGATNWLLMSIMVFILLQHKVELAAVVSVLLLAAVAGVITHIPGNLGVLEGVFVALLFDTMPAHEIVAGLVAYRVVYYLIPLLFASALFLVLEIRARRRGKAKVAASGS